MKFVVAIAILFSSQAFAKGRPARNPNKIIKSMVWPSDRGLKAPFWVVEESISAKWTEVPIVLEGLKDKAEERPSENSSKTKTN